MRKTARRIILTGTVQGCGMRPTLARLAARLGWTGLVRNCQDGVELIVAGHLPADEHLYDILRQSLPRQAAVAACRIESYHNPIEDAFHIAESQVSGGLSTWIPRDIAICGPCLEESHDPENRRHRYPFITCADCGPRFSLLRSMPFDRAQTSMSRFPMCAACEQEYHDPANRRYHAQTISCPRCGPTLWTSQTSIPSDFSRWSVLEAAADLILQSRIVAIRGVGGYQLFADASSDRAIRELRRRKQRLEKPFAILCRTLAIAQQFAEVDRAEENELCSAANPIVLLRQKRSPLLSATLNTGLADLGVMLPTTALHDLLLGLVGRPLVCTSANLEGDPLVYNSDSAQDQLRSLADLIVHHDCDIQHPIDDSVVRVISGRPVTIRAGRGLAPQPLSFEFPGDSFQRPPAIACGGHQKSAVAMANGSQIILGPHVGDLESIATRDRWCEQLAALQSMQGSEVDEEGSPQRIGQSVFACDSHPGYFSTIWAGEKSQSPCLVNHHFAHVLAGMAEHGWLDREVLGVAWDGTGFGDDGTVWGGEFLVTTRRHFKRLAHLRPFVLPGGEASIRDLQRLALSVVADATGWSVDKLANELSLPLMDAQRLLQLIGSARSPKTSSVGRLIDAASFLILGKSQVGYEGQAAMELEAVCNPAATGYYSLTLSRTAPVQVDWRPMIQQILSDRRSGAPAGDMAMRLHRALATVIIEVSAQRADLPVVLTGGVFQNRILVEQVARIWARSTDDLGLPGRIPPNDGGLAVGQLVAALTSATIQENRHVPGGSRQSCPLG